MDLTIKIENIINQLNFDLLSNQIKDYNEVNDYNKSIYIKNFEINIFWEIARLKNPIILFINEKLNITNNLLKRLETLENFILYPKTEERFLENNKKIKFNQKYYLSYFTKLVNFFNDLKYKEIIIFNTNKNLDVILKFNLPILSYYEFSNENIIYCPKILKLPNLITFLTKNNIKIFFIGKSSEVKNLNNMEYYFIDTKKRSDNFLKLKEEEFNKFNLKNNTLISQLKRRRKVMKPKKIIFEHKESKINNLHVLENPAKNKRIPMKDYKKYLEKINKIEYPIRSQIFKINFIIKNYSFIDVSKGNPLELLEYNLIYNLTGTFMVYYNSVLLNDKITENNLIDQDKFYEEFEMLKKNNYLYQDSIVKCPKDKFDLIFFSGDTESDLEIYNNLPFPKILSGGIVPEIWDDDRHIISFPSNKYYDIIEAGILKDNNNEIVRLPQRFIIKNNFLAPKMTTKKNLKNIFFADYLILIETNNYESIELSLIENIIGKLRVKYSKEIILCLNGDYKSENNWVKNINFTEYYRNIKDFDMIFILDDILNDNYNLSYTILEGVNYQIPLIMAKNAILNDNFTNYDGLFESLNKNILGINQVKNFFEKNLDNLICDNQEEIINFLKFKKETWNLNVMKHYQKSFQDIMDFLKKKNYLRTKVNLIDNSIDDYNFYYHENINNINLTNIYSNVDSFFSLIKPYKNILLISSDYPSYGGAATLNHQISNILKLKGHNCKELYYLFSSINDKDANKIIQKYKKPVDRFDFENLLNQTEEFFYEDIRVTKFNNLLDDLEKMEFKPDLIILKNHLNGVILPDKFNNIYYLIAGIYYNNLNKFYFDLSLNENEKFINKNVIETLKDKRIKGITNSLHTKKILEDNFNISTDLYYTNFILWYPKNLPQINLENFEKREYTYGIICSDFTRPIKNIQNICIDLAEKIQENEKVIFIGKNSKKYIKYFNSKIKIECVDLVEDELLNYYLQKIKYILINSYYESNSNLAIKAKFNSCQVIRKPINKSNNNLRILITSTQKPGHGGSATNAYKLTKWLRKLKYNVAIVFFNKESIEKVNIENLEGVFVIRDNIKNYSFYRNEDKITIRNNILKYLGGYPSITFAFNYYTPILSRKLFPYSYLYYFVVGNPVLSIGEESIINNEISINKFLKDDYNLETFNEETFNQEYQSIKISDEIVIDQGELNIRTLTKVHPEFKYLYNNYYNYGCNILLPDIINNEDIVKEFELIVVSSNWKRLVKNPKLVYLLYKKFPNYRKLVIGKNSNIFERIPNTTCLELLPYDLVQNYITKSKVLLVTSFSETGPNTLIEAFANKCQVLSSKNIGYQRYLKEYHLCEDVYDVEEWENKIKFLINNFNFLPLPKIEVEDDKNKFLNFIDHKKISFKSNVLVVCGDKPYYGGAATNSYNLIKLLKNNNYNVKGLFISYQKEGLDDPDNLDCVEHIFLDENIREKLIKWKKENHINFDLIFCKNYKVFTLVKLTFPDIPIIYSPSGLRQLTAFISKNKKFYLDSKNINLIDSNKELEKHENWFDFIMKNDKYLENYALENADYLLPNSLITFKIIKKYYVKLHDKLLEPIYLSNIQFIEKSNYNFRNRKYDFAFIATNWKRATKNIWLAKSLIKKFKGTNYKILIVGMNSGVTDETFPKDEFPNLEICTHMLRDEMIKTFQKIKTIIVTSFYESNPNVLVEAIYCGCNVVTSQNVGNHENLRKNLLVRDTSKINNWVSCMEVSTKKLFPYLGPTKETVSEEFLNLVNHYGNKQEAVGIYKVNAKWDILPKITRIEKFNYQWMDKNELNNFEEHVGRKTDIFSNIYLHIFSKLTEKLEFKNNHYLFIDESISIPIRTKWNNVNIWILNKPEQVLYFNQGKFYFVRGNYPNFYQKLIPINAYSIYYPATSFKYNFNIKKNEKIIKRDLVYYFSKRTHEQYNNFKMVLHHEDENYFKQFTKNKMVMFKKFGLKDTFYFQNLEKEYDIIYVAQAVQKSKNHQFIFEFIKYCDENNITISIAYVSDREYLENNYSNFYKLKDNSEIKLEFYNNIDPIKLAELYNKSKINLLLSNRDCVPRVIVESLLCGCYNVATDLLSDGKYYYDGICGELISFDYAEVKLIENGMVFYQPNPLLFKKIIKLVQSNYNHEKISKEASKLYNINNTVNSIIENL